MSLIGWFSIPSIKRFWAGVCSLLLSWPLLLTLSWITQELVLALPAAAQPIPEFTVVAEGQVTINNGGNFEGDPTDPSDDALLHGGDGFTINNFPTLPVQRDPSGQPLLDDQGRQILVDNAVTVAPGFSTINAPNNPYAGLLPPVVVPDQIVSVPSFADLKAQELEARIPDGAQVQIFNSSQNPINSAADWANRFPPNGSPGNPTVVQVINGGLNVPNGVDIQHMVIQIQQGSLNFNGSGHDLVDVVLVTDNGGINLARVQGIDLSVLATGTLNMNGGARFGGSSLLANDRSITFNGATRILDSPDRLRVIAQNTLTFNASADTRGDLLSRGNILFNSNTTLAGTIQAKGRITFNGRANVLGKGSGALPDTTPPQVAVALSDDTGANDSDQITMEPGIEGVATDEGGVISLTVALDGGVATQIAERIQADGGFSLDRAFLDGLAGGLLADGSHRLDFVATDGAGNQGTAQLSFVLDTTLEPLGFDLAAASDTEPVGDRQTTLATVTLVGETEPNASVELSSMGSTTADGGGRFQFGGSSLQVGANSFTVTATDIAGNQASQTETITRLEVDTQAPILAAGLANDTGSSSVDGVTSDPTLQGTVTDDVGVTQLQAQVNGNGFGTVLALVQPDGSFQLDQARLEALLGSSLSDGSYTVELRAEDEAGNATTATVGFQLDRAPPALTLELAPESDTEPQGDNQTTEERVTLVGQTEPDLSVLLQEINTTVTADPSGAFSLTDVTLELGDNSFTAQTQDLAGNSAQVSLTITRLGVFEPPVDLVLSNDSVPETDTGGELVGQLITLRPDPDAPYVYTLVEDPDQRFQVVGDQLRVAPGAVLDFEDQQSHSVTLRTTDARDASLFLEKSFTIRVTDVNEPPTQIQLSNSEIPENSPGGTIVGQFTTTDPDGRDSHTYTLLDDGEGRFQIVGETLEVAPGAALDFETSPSLTIQVESADRGGLTVDQSFTITLIEVNEPPIFTSTPVTEADPDNPYSYSITTTDPEGDARAITAENLPDWLSFTDNGDGTALLSGTPTVADSGIYDILLRATDVRGASAIQDVLITVNFVLKENSDFSPQAEAPLTIPAPPSLLSFRLDPITFDLSDANGINDAFEVILANEDGNSLVHTIGRGRDSYFNWTEGEDPVTAPGVSFDAATQEIQLNLVGVIGGTEARVIFRLVNNDSDTTTQVQIRDLRITEAPADTEAPVQTEFDPEFLPDSLPASAFTDLVDVTPSFIPEYRRTSFNETSSLLYVGTQIRNQGSYSIDAPLVLTISNLSDANVRVRNTDGFTPEGSPYINLGPLLSDGQLDPDEVSGLRDLVFFNPEQVQFSYQLKLFSVLNQGPVITSQPETEITSGLPYRYGVEATDPNEDPLVYELVAAPEGMVIDPESGLIQWDTTGVTVGSYFVQVQVRDGRGGIAEQSFTVGVIDPPGNRPPRFISTPVVDGAINVPYLYDSEAIDPDQDALTYGLDLGPEGMTIDPLSGEVEWLPPAELILGDTVLADITSPGEQDLYSFSGRVGQQIYIDRLRTQGDLQLRIISPGGLEVLDQRVSSAQGPLTLLENGSYRFEIDGNGDATGTYGFSLIDVSLAPVAELDQLIRGTLSPGSEDDLYRFSARAGERVFLDQLSTETGLGWTLYGADDRSLISSFWRDLELELPTDGEYLLALDGRSTFETRVPYAFRIVTPETQIQPLILGSNSQPNQVESTISEPGEIDIYTFTGGRNQRIFFDPVSDDFSTDQLSATLISPSGVSLITYRFSRGDSSVPLTLEETGQYRFQVDASGDLVGGYGFSLRDLGLSTAIDLDVEQSGQLDPGQEVELYQFTGSEGQRLYLDAVESSGFASWNLYGSGDQQLANASLSRDIELILPSSDTYTLAIRGSSNTPVDYRFRPITPDTIMGGEIQTDRVVTGEISEKGEQDLYTFTGTSDQRLFLDTQIERDDIQLELISPTQQTVVTRLDEDRFRDPLILRESGPYQVRIDGIGEATGQYQFQWVDLSAAPEIPLETAITGQLDPGSAVTAYRFVGVGGQRLYLDSQVDSSGARWILYDLGNQELGSAALDRDFELELPADGTYTLVLRGDDTTPPLDPIPYGFELISTVEPTLPLTLGQSVEVQINKLGQRINYSFTGNAGQQVILISEFGQAEIRATLTSPFGVEVFDVPTDQNGPLVTLQADGIHQLQIDGQEDALGTLRFRLADLTDASILSPGSSTGNQSLAGGDTALYQIAGDQSQQLQIQTLTGATGEWSLIAPIELLSGGSVLADVPLSQTIEALLPVDGAYLLTVRNPGSDPIAFDLQLTDTTPSVTNSGFGIVREGSVATGEEQTFTLEARAGSLIYVDSQDDDGDPVNLEILNPSGSRVILINGANDTGPLQLTQTGPYTLKLTGNGDFRFQVLDLEAAPALGIDVLTAVTLDPGQSATAYRIQGTAGQVLTYQGEAGNSSDVTPRLYSPAGREVSNFAARFNQGAILKSTGTYLLVLSGDQETSATTTFRLRSPIQIESSTSISGVFETPDPQVFEFQGEADQRVYLDGQITGDPRNLIWDLLTPDGRELAGTSSGFSDFEARLPSTGHYLLIVSRNRITLPINYSFQIIPSEVTTTPLTVGATISETISVAGEQDLFTFEGTQGQRLVYDGISGSQITATLISPSGTQILSLGVSGDRAPLTLDETGTYQVQIDGNGGATGDYQFRWLDVSAAPVLDLDTEQITTNEVGENQLYQVTVPEDLYVYIRYDRISGRGRWFLYGPGNDQIAAPTDGSGRGADTELSLPAGSYLLSVRPSFVGEESEAAIQFITPELLTTSIQIGDRISGSLTEFGQQDTYTFMGTAGQALAVDGITGVGAIDAQIFSPSGESIYDQRTNSDIDPLFLKETGEYRLVVDGVGRVLGEYQLRLLDPAVVAQPLPFDTTITGSLTPISERQFYQFTGQQGQRLYFDKASNWSNSAGWILYGPGGQRLAQPPPNNPDIEITLPGDGTYRLNLGGLGNTTTLEDYQFQVVTVPETQIAPLTLGDSVAGQIAEPGQQAIYTFDGEIGQQLVFDALEGDAQIRAQLIAESGVVLFDTRTDIDVAPLFLRETGSYQLFVDGVGDSTGSYRFQLRDLALEPSLPFDEQVMITLASGEESELYRFQGVAGQRLYLHLPTSPNGLLWSIYDPANQLLAQSSEDIEQVLPVSGAYTLWIRSFQDPLEFPFQARRSLTNSETLVFGEPIGQSLVGIGDRAEFAFAGQRGQRLFYDGQAAADQIQSRLLSPTGVELFATPSGEDHAPITLVETGNYQLLVDGLEAATGEFSFQVLDLSELPELELGVPVTEVLDAPGDTDLYPFQGQIGQRIRFALESDLPQSSSWTLYGPDDLSLNTLTPRTTFERVLPSTGLYVLALSTEDPDPVSYSFTSQDLTPEPVDPSGIGLLYSGTLAAGQIDDYSLSASTGQRVYLDSLDNNSGPVQVQLLDPQGAEVIAGGVSSDRGPVLLPETGTYTLRFQGNTSSSTGNYQLRVLELPAVAADPREDESVLEPEVQVITQLSQGRETQVFSLPGEVGQIIFYDGLATAAQSANVEAILYSPSGREILTQTDSRADSSPLRLRESGTYTLLIQGDADASNVEVAFQILDLSTAQQIRTNQQIRGSLQPGSSTQLYRFQGQAAQRLWLESNTSGTQASWILYGPGDQQTVSSARIDRDFEVVLPVTGEYVLALEGNTGATSSLPFEFEIFSPTSRRAVLRPGDGESGTAQASQLGRYTVQLSAQDGQGAEATQQFQIRVGPDPDNNSPLIVSEAMVKGFTVLPYILEVEAVDADEDPLTYLLTEGPGGMTLELETGRLSWLSPVAGIYPIQIQVEDGRGGVDSQTFELEISNQPPGRILGRVYLDLDGDGQARVTNPGNLTPAKDLQVAEAFAELYTAYPLQRPEGIPGRLGALTFLNDNTLLIGGRAGSAAGALYEVDVLRAEGRHIVGFDDDGDPQTLYAAEYWADSPYTDSGLVFTPEGALLANQWNQTGLLQIQEGAEPYQRLVLPVGGLSYVPQGLPGAGLLKAVARWASNVFYTLTPTIVGSFPDGTPRYDVALQPETTAGTDPGAVIYLPLDAPGREGTPSLVLVDWSPQTLRIYEVDGQGDPIDSTGEDLVRNYQYVWSGTIDPVTGDLILATWTQGGENNLVILRGLGIPSDNEPGLAGWRVFVDRDLDGQLDPDEESSFTDEQGRFGFLLAPGSYRIVQEVQPGWRQTEPVEPPYYELELPPDQVISGLEFGNTNDRLAGDNLDPTFTSTPPDGALITGEKLRYQATATDLNGDPLEYDLSLAPEGMSVSRNGVLAWRPSETQVGSFQVILRVRDDRGGVALQAFTLEVDQGNREPLILSSPPESSPQVDKLFQYQVEVEDLDGDELSYELVPDPVLPTTPNNAVLDPETGLLQWTPMAGQLGGSILWVDGVVEPWRLQIRVRDGRGGEAVQELALVVEPAQENREPEILSLPRTQTRTGDPYLYQVRAVDPDGELLSYEVTGPAGLSVTGEGVIQWLPRVVGSFPIQVTVRDPQGASAQQSYTLEVSGQVSNRAPVITSAPVTLTNLEREYRYDVSGFDPDGDLLIWDLDEAPEGMVIDPQSGAIRWQPQADQLGENPIQVRLVDPLGSFVIQSYVLQVTGTNLPPQIVSVPLTQGAVEQGYQYPVVAVDPEGDRIRYQLGVSPEGMSIDEAGVISWIPTQRGRYRVEVVALDPQGAVGTQRYFLDVGDVALNQAPQITSLPLTLASVGEIYTYAVEASDDDDLTYQLLQGPAGMSVDPDTGVLGWSNPMAGSYPVVVAALDPFGVGATQGYTLTVRVNQPPQILSVDPPTQALVGDLYRYDLRAQDPNGDGLSYELVTGPEGMTLDELGRVKWIPDAAGGPFPVELGVRDAQGAEVSQRFEITVVGDQIPPQVEIRFSQAPLDIGDAVTVFVIASDDVGLGSLSLTVDGDPVPLNLNGFGTVTPERLGMIPVVATATDRAGNQTVTQRDLEVLDPIDVTAPVIALSGFGDDFVTAPTDIIGTVTDDNLLDYTLSVAPIDTEAFTPIFTGTEPVENGVLGQFDPTLLDNGSYLVRLQAQDTGGNIVRTETRVDVSGDLKLGNFQLSFTDLEIPVSGIPITVIRTYDSLRANQQDELGFGWRLEFRDTDLRNSLGRDELLEELGVRSNAFDLRTRVYITPPGGRREAFTFDPEPRFNLGRLEGEERDTQLFLPRFRGDRGVTSTLTAAEVYLVQGEDDRFYGFNSGEYDPANVDYGFGGYYELTTQEGIVYRIDASTTDLISVTDPNDNRLTYTDDGIFSDSGKSVLFERDAQQRITSVTDPMNLTILYGYDSTGDLVTVTDRRGNTTEFVYEEPSRPHYLTQIRDPLNRPVSRTEYDEQGRLFRVIDAGDDAVEMVHDPNNLISTVRDKLGNPTTYEYDLRGNILTEVDARGAITRRTYDDDNNMLSITDPDGVLHTYTYDANRNPLTFTDGAEQGTGMVYDSRNLLTSVTAPTGVTTTLSYDRRRNLTQIVDADGLIYEFAYNNRGRLTRQVVPDGQITQFDYDPFGNPTLMIDGRGNEVEASYDLDGRVRVISTIITPGAPNPELALATDVAPQITNALYIPGSDPEAFTLAQSIDPSVVSVVYTYNSNGQVTSVEDFHGNSAINDYDTAGQLVRVTGLMGDQTRYRYDDKGQLREMLLPNNTQEDPNDDPLVLRDYDPRGLLISEIGPTGLETRFEYDSVGQQTDIIAPDLTPSDPDDNPRAKTEYTLGGRIEAEIDILSNRTEYGYDSLGQLDRIKDILDNVTTMTYDAGGQLASLTDPRLRTTQLRYDENGRWLGMEFFDGTQISRTYDELSRIQSETDALGQTTTYEYDSTSRLSAVINALNERTEYGYDSWRHVTQIKDPLGQITEFEYDRYGKPIAQIEDTGERMEIGYDSLERITRITDYNQHTMRYEYDDVSQLKAVELPNGSRTEYGYDPLNRLTTITDGNDHVTRMGYDDFYRQVETTLPLGQTSSMVYNSLGQLVTHRDFNGDEIQYSYDQYGRLDGKQFTDPQVPAVGYSYDPVTSNLVTVTNGQGVQSFGYDIWDRLESITEPDGEQLSYTYNDNDLVTSVTTRAGRVDYEFDPLNRLDKVIQNGLTLADHDYDPAGNLIQTEMGNGVVESRQYDRRNRLKEIETQDPLGQVLAKYGYMLDAVGNPKRLEELPNRVIEYDYDELDRLTKETYTDPVNGDRVIEHEYDLIGNRLSRNDSLEGTTIYGYDKNDRLRTATLGSQTTQFDYDDNGSLIRESDGTDAITYDWINDGENRLAGTNDGSSEQRYLYDDFGYRVTTVDDGERTNYLQDLLRVLPQEVMEYDSTGQIKADYQLGYGLIRSIISGETAYHHTDGVGSTRLLTDPSGQMRARYAYSGYGQIVGSEGSDANSYLFGGQRRDPSTGLDYLRARYYESELGRFISKDAFSQIVGRSENEIGDFINSPYYYLELRYRSPNLARPFSQRTYLAQPQGQHSYLYANANPIRYGDPTGYFTFGDVISTLAIAGFLFGSSGSAGYITAAVLSGEVRTVEDALVLADQLAAGIAHAATFGLVTQLRTRLYGETATRNHEGFLWNMGQIIGTSFTVLYSTKTPHTVRLNMGADQWIATVVTTLGEGVAAVQTGNNIRQGRFGVSDVFTVLPLFQTAAAGLSRSIIANFRNVKQISKVRNWFKMRATALFDLADCRCFAEGTTVLTPEGEKAIEEILPGDYVLAEDPEVPGEIRAEPVLGTFAREVDSVIELTVGDQVIVTTEDHPFWVPDRGWVEAQDLQVGDRLLTDSEAGVGINGIHSWDGDYRVHNLNVKEVNTFFISRLNLLVHNICEDNIDRIRQLLQDSPLRTQQERVSVPRIRRYADLLRKGVDMGFVGLDDIIIVDGHHRYIASQLAGVNLPTRPATRAPYKLNLPTKPISQIDLDPTDY